MCQKVLHTLRLLQKFNVSASLNECCLLFSAELSLLTLTEAVSRLRCVCLFAAWPVVVATLTLCPFLIILVVVVVVVLPLLEYFSVAVAVGAAVAVDLVKSN